MTAPGWVGRGALQTVTVHTDLIYRSQNGDTWHLLREAPSAAHSGATYGQRGVRRMDIALQRWLFRQDMRMGKTERKRDHKNAEGDPQRFRERRRARLEDAKLRALTGLRHATFITRSRETGLAFRYHPPDTMFPTLVAKARSDYLARFLAEARRRDLPSVDDQKGVERMSRRLEVGKWSRDLNSRQFMKWMKPTKVLR